MKWRFTIYGYHCADSIHYRMRQLGLSRNFPIRSGRLAIRGFRFAFQSSYLYCNFSCWALVYFLPVQKERGYGLTSPQLRTKQQKYGECGSSRRELPHSIFPVYCTQLWRNQSVTAFLRNRKEIHQSPASAITV